MNSIAAIQKYKDYNESVNSSEISSDTSSEISVTIPHATKFHSNINSSNVKSSHEFAVIPPIQPIQRDKVENQINNNRNTNGKKILLKILASPISWILVLFLLVVAIMGTVIGLMILKLDISDKSQ